MKTITIAGNLGKDAVTRHTQGGDSVTGFSVAVEERTGQDKRTIWFDVAIWGKRGTALQPHLSKGARVAVAGDLSTREHEGKTYLTVRADQVTLMGGGERRDAQPESRDAPARGSAHGARTGGVPDMDDEIPFAPEVRA
jgi:single-strand DNA-binding protein